MAGDTKDVELRIRARDYSQKALTEVVDALDALVKAQDEQIASAKKGETSAKGLEDSYRRIEDAAKALLKQDATIKLFKRQAEATDQAKLSLVAAREAQEAYAKSLVGVDKVTSEQTKQLNKLAAAVRRAEGAQQRAADRLDSTAAKLADYGIATDALDQSQTRIAASITKANAALELQDASIISLDADTRAYRATQQQANEEQVKANKALADGVAFRKAMADQREREVAASLQAKTDFDAAIRLQKEAETVKRLEAEERALLKTKKDVAEFEKAIAAQRERERAGQLESIDASRRERDTLRTLGLQLEATAKGFKTLAVVSREVRQYGLAQSLKDIADPATAALRSINGVEQSLAALESRVRSINGPVKGAQEAMRGLADAQKGIVAIGSQIDAYRKQIDVLRAVRAEYVASRVAVRELVEQLKVGTGGDDIGAKIAAAQSKLRGTSDEMGRQIQKTRELQTALRATGVATNDLAAAEQNLLQQSELATQATNQLTEAVKKNGTAKEKTASVSERFAKGERTTLGYMQRLRGEVLAVTTSYIGLQAAIGLVSQVLDVVRDQAKIESRLSEVFGGDQKKIAEELVYLRTQADRIGVSFRDTALQYSKFLTAAAEGNFTLQESRYIFEQFAQNAVRAGLTGAEFEGVMLAITQSISKGKIAAEELTGQLAERLPGALQKMAKAEKTTTEELVKRMASDNGLTIRSLINLAGEIEKANATAIDTAATNYVKAAGRFETAKDDFLMAVANSGFTQEFTDFLNRLSKFLNSDDGKKFAKSFGETLTALTQAVQLLVENFDAVKTVLGALVALKVGSWFVSLAKGAMLAVGVAKDIARPLLAINAAAIGTGTAMGIAAGGVGLLTTALKVLVRATPQLAAAWAVWELGSYALDKWREASKKARAEKDKLTAAQKDSRAPKTENPGTGSTPGDQTLKELDTFLEKNQTKIDRASKASRLRGSKGELEERQRIATEELSIRRQTIADEIKDEKKKGEAFAKIDAQILQVRKTEEQKFNNERQSSNETEASKRKRLAEEVAQELLKIQDDVAKRETAADPTSSIDERLKTRLAAIAHEYDKLRDKVRKVSEFNPAAAKTADEAIAKVVKQRQEVEAIKVRTEELQRLEKQLADSQSVRTAKLEENKALYEAGALSLQDFIEANEGVNDKFGSVIDQNIYQLREYAVAIKELLDPTAYEQLITRLSVTQTQNRPGAANAKGRADSAEGEFNRLLEQRKILLDDIALREKLMLITNEEAVAKTNQVNGQYKQQIIDTGAALMSYITMLRSMTNDPAAIMQLDALAAKIAGVTLETQNAQQAFTGLEQTIIGSATRGMLSTFESMVDTLGQVIVGQSSVKDGFKSMAQAGLQMFSQLLKEAAMYIIKMQLIKALQGAGPYGQIAASAIQATMPVGVKHTGGRAGSPSSASRSIAGGSWMGSIPQMHDGGVPGLNNNEVLRVLEKNEEVITADDSRHVMNGGASPQQAMRFVLVDDRSKIPEAMASAEGEQVTMLNLRRNIATVKQMLSD